ncbi:hypothetical protein QZH41_018319, partial [Actinostola sp. cb2023]
MTPTALETGEESKQEAQNNNEELYGVDLTENQDGGVRKRVLVEGTGLNTAPTGSSVSVKYTGKFLNGDEFDSNIGSEPFQFVLGEGVVIRGWDIGIPTMKLHEKARITVQPGYGYGKQGGSKIPPDSVLQFEIEVIDWKGTNVTKNGQVTKIIVTKGQGHDRPNIGAQVEVHLTGRHDGTVFDDRDVAFTFGEGSEANLLDGVEEAIGKMVNQECAEVKIEPGRYGFGPKGNPELNIPGNATLNYQIEVKNMEKLSDAWELSNDEKIATALRMKDKGTKFFKALEIEKENIKAVFRRGKEGHCACYKIWFACGQQIDWKNARLALKDYDYAKDDFLAVITLDPRNREAREQLKIVNQNLKIQHEKDKKTF